MNFFNLFLRDSGGIFFKISEAVVSIEIAFSEWSNLFLLGTVLRISS